MTGMHFITKIQPMFCGHNFLNGKIRVKKVCLLSDGKIQKYRSYIDFVLITNNMIYFTELNHTSLPSMNGLTNDSSIRGPFQRNDGQERKAGVIFK